MLENSKFLFHEKDLAHVVKGAVFELTIAIIIGAIVILRPVVPLIITVILAKTNIIGILVTIKDHSILLRIHLTLVVLHSLLLFALLLTMLLLF